MLLDFVKLSLRLFIKSVQIISIDIQNEVSLGMFNNSFKLVFVPDFPTVCLGIEEIILNVFLIIICFPYYHKTDCNGNRQNYRFIYLVYVRKLVDFFKNLKLLKILIYAQQFCKVDRFRSIKYKLKCLFFSNEEFF